jgi:hypothetical protein
MPTRPAGIPGRLLAWCTPEPAVLRAKPVLTPPPDRARPTPPRRGRAQRGGFRFGVDVRGLLHGEDGRIVGVPPDRFTLELTCQRGFLHALSAAFPRSASG